MIVTQENLVKQIAEKENMNTATVHNVFKSAENIIFACLSSTTPLENTVNALYPDISDATASKLLTKLQKEQILVNANKKTWQDYFNGLRDGEKWQIEFVQNTDLQKASLDDVKGAYNSARESAIAHNAALQQQTLGAKAATVATKALAIAGNMIAMWAISKGNLSHVLILLQNLFQATPYSQIRIPGAAFRIISPLRLPVIH